MPRQLEQSENEEDDNDDGNGDVGDDNKYQVVWAETSQVGCGWAYYRFATPPSSLWPEINHHDHHHYYHS